METLFEATPLEAVLFSIGAIRTESLRDYTQAQCEVTTAMKRKGLLKIIKSGAYSFRVNPIAYWNETDSLRDITTEVFFGLIDNRNITKGAERFPGLFAPQMNGYRPNLYLDIETLGKAGPKSDYSLSLILPILAQTEEQILGRMFMVCNSGIGFRSSLGALALADDLQLVSYSESIGFLHLFTYYIEKWNREWGKANRPSSKPILF